MVDMRVPMLFPKELTGRQINELLLDEVVQERLTKKNLLSSIRSYNTAINHTSTSIIDVSVDISQPHVRIKDIIVDDSGIYAMIIGGIKEWHDFIQLLFNTDERSLYVAPVILKTPLLKIITFHTYVQRRDELVYMKNREHAREIIDNYREISEEPWTKSISYNPSEETT